MPHLFVAVTAHGYGHLALVAPLIHALCQQQPHLRVTLAGQVNPHFVRRRLPPTVQQVDIATDVALPMDGPLTVKWQDGLARYEAFETNYPAHLAQQLAWFERDPPDLVLSSVAWLPLDAAHQLGIPAVALGPLNWYDILASSPVAAQMSTALATRLQRVYAAADLFICPTPSMPMTWLPNVRTVGPIAAQRPRDRATVAAQLDLDPSATWVLMQFGGAGRLPLGGAAAHLPGVQILTPDRAAAVGNIRLICDADHSHGCDGLGVLASCDVLMTKPGYNSFAEAACHGIPVLYARRDDWAETRYLVDWLEKKVPTRAITAAALAQGDIATALAQLTAAPPSAITPATGVADCLALLKPWLFK
ncbi:hypothetical protein HUU62_25105 [Rhodoferax sp. 4810]|uniref:Uncharacterized protein n=1 Tax=Thiospirillum jenense TaxID=1653858 RepID=A0A839HFZ8_9GAMM|nr:hypothetical protein [Thiospirillum jenense]MBB1077686.1 hypothetical protein [Rhodoferax jenense]MBB1127314.1 hypothetical protein [Thiospirillum jenense]